MALLIRFWPDSDSGNVPKTWKFRPGLYDGSVDNVAAALAFAKQNWNKVQKQSIMLSILLNDGLGGSRQLDDIYAVGQGQPTPNSCEWNIRNDLKGWDKYGLECRAVYEALANEGYEIDHIIMDLEGASPTKNVTFNTGTGMEFPFSDVLQQMYTVDANGFPVADPTGLLPMLNIIDLMKEQYTIREAFLANGLWNGWLTQKTAEKLNRVLGNPAREVWNGCQISNYEWSKYPHYPMMDFGQDTGTSIATRNARPSVIVKDWSAPVLYIHTDYFSNVTECLASLYLCELPAIPWVGGLARIGTGDEWANLTTQGYYDLLEGIENYGCERVMVF